MWTFGKSAALVLGAQILAGMAVGQPAASSARVSPPSAWQLLPPEARAGISEETKRAFQVLSPEQAEVYLDEDPNVLNFLLANGETLQEFLERGKREDEAGLVLKTLDTCPLLDTGRGSIELVPEAERVLKVRDRREAGTYGSSSVCGVPGFVGEVFKSSRAKALLLSVEINGAQGPGTLKIWPEGSTEPDRGVMTFTSSKENPQVAHALVVKLCDEETPLPCPNGDLRLDVEGSRVEVTIWVEGYFEPAVSRPASIPSLPKADSINLSLSTAVKSLSAPFWEQKTDTAHIYYLDGKVGVGTNTPLSDLHVEGGLILSDPADQKFLIRTLPSKNISYAGGVPHDVQTLHLVTPYQDEQNLIARTGLTLASPEAWGGETAYLYTFEGKNLRLGIADDQYRRSEIELHNRINPFTSEILFRTGAWRDPGSVPGSRTGVSMLIDEDGHVGIGTTEPEVSLDLVGDFKLSGRIVSDGNLALDSEGEIEIRTNGSDSQLYLTDYTGGEKTRMGYSNDKDLFAIHQSAGSETNSFFIRYAAAVKDPVFQFDTNTTPNAWVVSEKADVGIGTATPEVDLHVLRNGSQASVYVERTDGHFTGMFSGSGFSGLAFEASSPFLLGPVAELGTVPVAVLTITPEGNIGVNDSSPEEALEVEGNVKLSGKLISNKIDSDGDLKISSGGDICIGNCG